MVAADVDTGARFCLLAFALMGPRGRQGIGNPVAAQMSPFADLVAEPIGKLRALVPGFGSLGKAQSNLRLSRMEGGFFSTLAKIDRGEKFFLKRTKLG